MCGIAGIVNLDSAAPIEERRLRQMVAMIRHRGPDQFGIYLDDRVGLGSARLSIVDLGTGQQPIANEDGTLWIVFNGEIFNHLELRPELEARGHRFSTHTDTEVVLHLYEDEGPRCLQRLNGQFAIAIWDVRRRTLFLARDRLGVRPLFYTTVDGALIFGSEVKAILADPRVCAEADPVALHQIFTFWSVFGDAGSATALEVDSSDAGESWWFSLNTDGSGWRDLIVEGGGFRDRFPADRRKHFVTMNGAAIFNFAIKRVPAVIEETLKAADLDREAVDYFILHQSNLFIMRHLAKKMKIPEVKIPFTIQRFGSAGGPSIPLTLTQGNLTRPPDRPLRLMAVGYGVGFSWGSALLTLPPDAALDHVLVSEPFA